MKTNLSTTHSQIWIWLLALTPFWSGAQPVAFMPGDSLKFMAECYNALDNYRINLENIGTLAESGSQMLVYKQSLMRECFYKPTVIVYNDLANEKFTADEYATQIFGQRTEVRINLDKATYRLNRLPDGRLEMVSFVEQNITFGKPQSRQTRKNQLGIYYNFTVFAGPNGYEPQDYRIVKIEKLNAPPAGMRSLPRELNIDSLRSRERDLAWVARRLAIDIRKKLPVGTRSIYLQKFSYNRSSMTNEFSDQLLSTLHYRLKNDEGINADAAPPGAAIGVRGGYIQKADVVEVTTELFEPATGKTISTLRPNMDLPMNWLREKGMQLKPEGTDQAMAVQKTIMAEALPTIPPIPGKLSIQLSTTLKGKQHEFWENDTMYVRIRVNKPSHVRLLYVQSDEKPALLWSDFEIKPGEENKDIFFPTPFVCVPPFGQETLIAVASNLPFCPVKVTRNLYDVEVVDGILADAIKSVRCTNDRGVGKAAEQTEARITLTTRAVAMK